MSSSAVTARRWTPQTSQWVGWAAICGLVLGVLILAVSMWDTAAISGPFEEIGFGLVLTDIACCRLHPCQPHGHRSKEVTIELTSDAIISLQRAPHVDQDVCAALGRAPVLN
jgi:hypothetical protein